MNILIQQGKLERKELILSRQKNSSFLLALKSGKDFPLTLIRACLNPASMEEITLGKNSNNSTEICLATNLCAKDEGLGNKHISTFKRRGYLHILCIGVTRYPSSGTSVFFLPPSSIQF